MKVGVTGLCSDEEVKLFLFFLYADDQGLAILVVCMQRIVLRLNITVIKLSCLKFENNFDARNSILIDGSVLAAEDK